MINFVIGVLCLDLYTWFDRNKTFYFICFILKKTSLRCLSLVVPKEGFEPSRLATYAPKAYASASSATSALSYSSNIS